MGLPLWLYHRRLTPTSILSSWLLGGPLLMGRILCAAVEIYVIGRHLNALLDQDIISRKQRCL